MPASSRSSSSSGASAPRGSSSTSGSGSAAPARAANPVKGRAKAVVRAASIPEPQQLGRSASIPKTHRPSGLECRLAVLGVGADVRLTPHRREVFEVLAASTDHPTAYEVLERVKARWPAKLAKDDQASAGPAAALRARKAGASARQPAISLATVYNCLEHLCSAGLIKQVHLERGQSRYCANLHEHVHFHCESCGQVVDAHPSAPFDPASFWNLPAGTRIARTDLAIHGLCSECAAPKTAAAKPKPRSGSKS